MYRAGIVSLAEARAGPLRDTDARRYAITLLFVAIQVLYKMFQQDKSLSPDNLDRFRSYVERHQKLGGPDRAIVETWRRAVLGR